MAHPEAHLLARRLPRQYWEQILDSLETKASAPGWVREKYDGLLSAPDGTGWAPLREDIVEFARAMGESLGDVEFEALRLEPCFGPAHLLASSRLVRLGLLTQLRVHDGPRITVKLLQSPLGYAVARIYKDPCHGCD